MSLREIVGTAEEILRQGTFIAREIQGIPQGFEDFKRSAGPVMKAQSLKFNAYTFALWFGGDVVQINPNGGLNVVARVPSVAETRLFVTRFALTSGHRVFLLICPPNVKVTDFNQVNTRCSFQEFSTTTGESGEVTPPPPETPPPGTSDIGGSGPPIIPPSGNDTPPSNDGNFKFPGGLEVSKGALALGGVLAALVVTEAVRKRGS